MILDNIPDDIVVNSRVPMNDEIPKADDFLPLNIGILATFIQRDL